MQLQVKTGTELSEPALFSLGSREIAVIEIVDRWPGNDYTYFKVLADDGNTYILRHDDKVDQWEMTYFQTGSPS
jgi:phage FluMu gp28-like protein